MPPPATTDELFDVIDRSGLLPADVWRTCQPSPGRMMSKDAVLARMTRDGVITPFHAKQLGLGRHRGFFLNVKYKLLAHLGSGGNGQVYLCEHLLLGRLVAVKILLPSAVESAGAVQRFFREAKAVAALDSPNIVRVFDMDQVGESPFMVMEYVDGTNLHAVVAQGEPLAVARAANYARQAALGLAHAHAAGLVHRDVKPGNLLVDRAGVVKLLDLGLARFFTHPERNKNLTAKFDAKSVVGTADFMAPEQARDSSGVDIRADIYGLGGTLYYLLAGRSPFEGATLAQKLDWQQTRPPPPITEFRRGVPAGLVAVLERMLAKNPTDRYAAPDAVVKALAPWGEQAVPPPSAAEMPLVPASAYRLGLSPPPPAPSRSADSTAETPTIEPDANSEGEPTVDLLDPHTPNADAVLSKAPRPTVAAAPPRPPVRGWWLAAAAVGLVAAGAFLSWLLRP